MAGADKKISVRLQPKSLGSDRLRSGPFLKSTALAKILRLLQGYVVKNSSLTPKKYIKNNNI